jgi:hypothetical protein
MTNVAAMKERLDRLRELLQTASDFRQAWDYFHEELVQDPAFLQLGQPASSRRLEAVLGAVGSRLLGRELRPQHPMLLHFQDLSFWHGSCGLGGYVAVCFHFEDIDHGLVGIMKGLTSHEILLARLSLLEMRKGEAVVGRWGEA